jgi:hypothetical protein
LRQESEDDDDWDVVGDVGGPPAEESHWFFCFWVEVGQDGWMLVNWGVPYFMLQSSEEVYFLDLM